MTRKFRILLSSTAILSLAACAGADEAGLSKSASVAAGAETVASYSEKGKAEFEAGRFGNAIGYYRKAVDLDPFSVSALNGLAAAYDRIGRSDVAERLYLSALRVDPSSTQTLNNLGYSYLLRGKKDLASVYLRDAATQSGDADKETIQSNLRILTQSAETPVGGEEAEASPKQEAVKVSASFDRGRDENPNRPRLVRLTKYVYAIYTKGLDVPPRPKTYVSAENEPAKNKHDAALIRPREMRQENSKAKIADAAPVPVAQKNAEPNKKGATIEVSNGTGRLGMAARMRSYLTGAGGDVGWITNADDFEKKSSVIFFKPGYEEQALFVAKQIPIQPELVSQPDQRADVHLQLGADLLSFDARLISDETRRFSADAQVRQNRSG